MVKVCTRRTEVWFQLFSHASQSDKNALVLPKKVTFHTWANGHLSALKWPVNFLAGWTIWSLSSTQYCNTESFFLYSPSYRPTSHMISDVASGSKGVTSHLVLEIFARQLLLFGIISPANVRSYESLTTFRRHLKSHLFQSAFATV